ncbi:MAG: hypothetical protein WHS64_05040 [Fervidobacterium sp.]|uniref:Uncharacterized protein n=1 Tax=Fervidobacterium gondwanense DSM 13020 TaxID=1121883 RepID=A0A1M7T2M0_FERGO|nr:hypothetical protein [Fervidobacterium gondwanense]UXF01686.1 hypothetical protein IB67_09215 [Fervidobacterium riparium]SHN64939.1 hypothetical protein SAMN02745226_01469 [Fervidobacterium gondwanense DSM 13020]
MVKVILNGIEKEFESGLFESFGELLKSVLPEGHVLKTLRINSKDIPVAFVDELKGARLDEELLIELETQDTMSFLKETLNDVLGYIKHVKTLLPQVASSILTGEEAGWKAIKDLAEGLSAMENLRNSTIQITKLSDNELALGTNKSDVTLILKELVEVLDRRDNFEISDVIENKIPDVLDYYIEYFSKVLETIEHVN